MSSEILPAEKVKTLAPLARFDDDVDHEGREEDVTDAAPGRRIRGFRQCKVSPADAAQIQAPFAQEKDDTDIALMSHPTRPPVVTSEFEQRLLENIKHPTTTVNYNNNITVGPAPVQPKGTYAHSKYVYNMHHKQRGKAVIINNINFNPETGMNKRSGSDSDACALNQVLQKLGFNVMPYTDLTIRKTTALLQNISSQDYSKSDCFLLAIMTHGDEGVLYCIDGVIPVEEMMRPFRGDKCTSLAGKPKLFFIQACRGQELDSGVEIGTTETDAANSLHGEDTQIIPSEADFLVAYSSPPGYYSWRNQGVGAWFIQAIASVLMEFGTALEIQQIMTRVNHVVSYEYASHCTLPGYDQKKQVPCIVSTLTKELYFGSTTNVN